MKKKTFQLGVKFDSGGSMVADRMRISGDEEVSRDLDRVCSPVPMGAQADAENKSWAPASRQRTSIPEPRGRFRLW